jgi:hypothetical protein
MAFFVSGGKNMGNLDNPRGARIYGRDYGMHPYKHSSGDSVAIYPGDFVHTAAGYCNTAAATERLLGVAANYVAASTAGDVMVYDDPRQEFIIQDDLDSTDTTLTIAEVGENCDILATAGNSTLKISKMEMDGSTHNTTTQQLHIVRLADITFPDGTVNDYGAHANWVVRINEHESGPAENVGT